MELINCKRCGALTVNRFEGYCNRCNTEREELISRIKDFIVCHKGAGISEIVAKTKIPSRVVLEFIHEGRIR